MNDQLNIKVEQTELGKKASETAKLIVKSNELIGKIKLLKKEVLMLLDKNTKKSIMVDGIVFRLIEVQPTKKLSVTLTKVKK